MALGAGWVINRAVVEYVIGRRRVAPSGPISVIDHLEVKHQDDGTNTLAGLVQAQLHGLCLVVPAVLFDPRHEEWVAAARAPALRRGGVATVNVTSAGLRGPPKQV